MKQLVFGVAAFVAVAATSFAGTETYSGKEYKQVETAGPFSDKEIQLDAFGAYQVGHGPTHAGPIHDHAWGGGVAVNYFFARYFGLSAEGTWLSGHDNGSTGNTQTTQFQSATGSLIFRYPIDSWSIAPYAFIGGGGTWDGSGWGLGHIGVGMEYRVVPNKFGIFADGRWNYYGDRYGHGNQNNFLIRLGTRYVF